MTTLQHFVRVSRPRGAGATDMRGIGAGLGATCAGTHIVPPDPTTTHLVMLDRTLPPAPAADSTYERLRALVARRVARYASAEGDLLARPDPHTRAVMDAQLRAAVARELRRAPDARERLEALECVLSWATWWQLTEVQRLSVRAARGRMLALAHLLVEGAAEGSVAGAAVALGRPAHGGPACPPPPSTSRSRRAVSASSRSDSAPSPAP